MLYEVITLHEAVAALSSTPGVRGLMIGSDKESFIVGADITEFAGLFALGEQALTVITSYSIHYTKLYDLVSEIRQFFSGTMLLSGCISSGRDIATARMLGADLAYAGSRFINTRESRASAEYKQSYNFV